MGYNYDLQKVATINLPWEKLNGCSILITGATGLIGSCLVEVLMERKQKDYQVYALGRNKERAMRRFQKYIDEPRFHYIEHDIVEPLSSNVNFTYIIHAASNASPNFFATKPVEVIKANINGVLNLMEYGLSHELKRFLYVSSGEIYGEGDGRVFTENYCGYIDSMSPRSCYPSSKRAAETLCVSYSSEYDVETVIARPCHIYGPYFTESDNRVYAQFFRNIIHGEDIVMKSTGKQFRSWCYVVDCVSALLHILLKGDNANAYNIADASSNITILELAETIAKLGGKEVVIRIPSREEKNGYSIVAQSVFSTKKLETLGWKPIVHIKDGLKRTYDELLSVNF